jgi:3-oxoacyl-[acyl-carrier protein] reductase
MSNSHENILDLKGKIGLVTGAGQGVGRQIAIHLAGNGAGGVVVNDFVLERAEAVAKEIEALGCRALPIAADVTDRDAVNAMVDQAIGEFGGVDILVNNAGNAGADPSRVGTGTPFWELPTEAWDGYLGVNLYGVFNCTGAVIPGMIESGRGRLITVISEAGRMGVGHMEMYSAAKAGAAGFTRSVASTLGKHLITANTVSVAATRTPTTAPLLSGNEEVEKQLLRDSKYTIRRFGEPDDVAGMVLFLASDAASWISGQNYPVNGGCAFNL